MCQEVGYFSPDAYADMNIICYILLDDNESEYAWYFYSSFQYENKKIAEILIFYKNNASWHHGLKNVGR
jgi:hypothetical protein